MPAFARVKCQFLCNRNRLFLRTRNGWYHSQLLTMPIYRSSGAAGVLCFLLTAALAQEPTGAIAGSVTDPSGASVPRARVVVKHKQTGQGHVQTTIETGFF